MREELQALGEQIAEQAVHLDAAMHRLLVNLRTFDERGGWHAQGFQSCAHWLSWRVGWDLATARDRVRVAHQLGGLPKVQAAMETGELSYSKARAIARVATPQTEETLLVYAEYAPAAQLEKICQKLRTVERAGEAKKQQPHPEERYVQSRPMEDGMMCVKAVLRPEEAAMGEPLSAGRRTRTIPAAIKRALLVRDKTCRFPGCSNHLFLDGHHIKHWADGGETKLSNLALLYSSCHARLHEHGYQMGLVSSGALVFRDPEGQVIPAMGERPRLNRRWVGWPAIEQQNEGLLLHAETAIYKGNGRPVNYQLAVGALLRMQEQRPG